MRHGKKFNHLGRKSAHRQAMLSNMATSLILHKRINTTVAKAKELRKYVEPLLTRSKSDTTHSRRVVFSYLQNKEAVTILFRDVSLKIADRPGGYTRILKTGNRLGDNASMCFIELVDYNENLLNETSTPKPTKTTRRRGSKKSAKTKTETATQEDAEDGAQETIKEEAPKAAKKTASKKAAPKTEKKEANPKSETKVTKPKKKKADDGE